MWKGVEKIGLETEKEVAVGNATTGNVPWLRYYPGDETRFFPVFHDTEG